MNPRYRLAASAASESAATSPTTSAGRPNGLVRSNGTSGAKTNPEPPSYANVPAVPNSTAIPSRADAADDASMSATPRMQLS